MWLYFGKPDLFTHFTQLEINSHKNLIHTQTTYYPILTCRQDICVGLGTVSANLGILSVSRVWRRLLPTSSAVGGGGFCSICWMASVSSIGLCCRSSRVMLSSLDVCVCLETRVCVGRDCLWSLRSLRCCLSTMSYYRRSVYVGAEYLQCEWSKLAVSCICPLSELVLFRNK